LLEIQNLQVCYGRVTAVRDVSIALREGEIVTLVGANGAGKSTLLKTVHGIVPAVHGSLIFEGADVAKLSTAERVQLGIALVPEGRHVFANLSVEANLELGFTRPGGSSFKERQAEVFDFFPRLLERRTQKAGTLSGGEQQMLAIGRALMSRPRLLMMDEPTLGLAPVIIKLIKERLQALKSKGYAILLAEQNVHMALSVADRGYVISNGEVVGSGSSSELLQSQDVQRAYLGAA